MSVTNVYEQDGITAYCADRHSIFRPHPAKDSLLERAQAGSFTLKAGKQGITAFQIILAVDADAAVTAVRGEGLSCLNTGGVDIHGKDFARLQEIIDEQLVLDQLRTDVVEVKLWQAAEGTVYRAVRESAYLEVKSYGGDTSGYQIPFALHYTGEKQHGSFDVVSKVFTPD